jgi:hypothetical protein
VLLVRLIKAATTYLPRCVMQSWFDPTAMIVFLKDIMMTSSLTPRDTDVAATYRSSARDLDSVLY